MSIWTSGGRWCRLGWGECLVVGRGCKVVLVGLGRGLGRCRLGRRRRVELVVVRSQGREIADRVSRCSRLTRGLDL